MLASWLVGLASELIYKEELGGGGASRATIKVALDWVGFADTQVDIH